MKPADIWHKLVSLEQQAAHLDRQQRTMPGAQLLSRRYDLEREAERFVSAGRDVLSRSHAEQLVLGTVGGSIVDVREISDDNGEPAPFQPPEALTAQRKREQDAYRARAEAAAATDEQRRQAEWAKVRDAKNAELRRFRADKMLEGADPSKLPQDLPQYAPKEWGVKDGVVTRIPYKPLDAGKTDVTALGEGSRKVERTVELHGDPFGRRAASEIPPTPNQTFGDA